MLWKSSHTVGFGYAGAYLVARYCADPKASPLATYPKPPATGIPAFALNVCPSTGCPSCKSSPPQKAPGLGYDNCYNDRALKYVNDLRKMAGAPALTLDTAMATKAQTWATTFNLRGAGASSDATRPETCASLTFHQTIPSKISTLATSGDAELDWWAGSSEYNPTTGGPKGTSSDSIKKTH